MSRPAFRMLLDFDGTLVEPNVAIELVSEFVPDGKRVAREVDDLLHSGRISLREAWSRQVALLDPHRLDEMARWSVEHTPLRAGATELVTLLRRHAIPTTVVSGGLDFYIHPILRRHGFDLPVRSDRLEVNDGSFALLHPYGHPTCRLCGICKAAIAQPAPDEPLRSVFAGDGSTDRYAAEVADIVFARRRLRQYCDAAAIPYFPFEEFGPFTEKIAAWLEHREPLPPPRRLGVATSACPISQGWAARSGP